MRVTLHRPEPSGAPWLLTSRVVDVALLEPPLAVARRIEGNEAEVEAELGQDGKWSFPAA